MVGLEGTQRSRRRAEARRPKVTSWIAACALLAASAALAQGTWTSGWPMPTPRAYVATGVADGQLYVALGAPQNTRLEAYDPDTDSWTVLADLWPDRSLFAGDVIDGKLYVVGGCINTDCNPRPTDRLDVYDPETNVWSAAAPMPTRRHSPGVAALGGRLYVVGGGTGGPCCPVVGVLEAYDPATNAWQALAPMPTPREALVAVALGGRLYAIGGQVRPGDNHWTGEATGVVEVYDPLTNSWSSAPPMPTERTHLEAAEVDGRIHVLGGSFFDTWPPEREWVWFLDSHEIYDPVTESWSAAPAMPTARYGLGVEFIGGTLYAVGGLAGPFPPSATGVLEIFAPEVNQPPTADAGPDQAIHAGVTVELDGGGSWDDNTPTADLLYAWTFSNLPAESEAVLSGADTPTPSFVADLAATYGVQLVVTDEEGLASAPDEVLVSAENLPPTAAAGEDQLAVVGTTVQLDGRESDDPEDDPMSFAWSMVAAPAGSTAALVGADTDLPTLVPDLAGLYRMRLVVSDPIGPGWPDEVEVTATTAEVYAEIQIVESGDTVEELVPAEVTTQGNQQAYLNFLGQAMLAIQEADLETAIHKLEQAIERADGCALRGAPDGNGPGRDWITDCTAQLQVYLALTDALEALLPSEP